jgi:protein phosphatase
VRDHNEDSLYFDVRDRLMIVCDGMGGHAGGHIASELAVQVVSNSLRLLKPGDWLDEDRLIEAIKNAVFGANDHILSRARVDSALSDMGTTIVVSQDHSLVAERIRAGLLDPDSDEANLLGNIVTRALGMDQVTIDITVEDLVAGDVYLLCSDGLSDQVSDKEILAVVEGTRGLDQACLTLVELANQRGGIDNVTVAMTKALG